MIIKVKNLNGTSNNYPPDGFDSWLSWWENKKSKMANNCANVNCDGTAEVGGHVKCINTNNNQWFITPLCKKCNNSSNDTEFFVSSNDLEPIINQ